MARHDNTPPAGTIAEWLRKTRRARGISLTNMARKSGYQLTYLSAVENGHKPPGQELIRTYSEITGYKFKKREQ